MTRSIPEILNEYALPGAVVGILRADGIDLRTFGYVDDAQSRPVTGDTVYGIGSISKVFTAFLAMRLVSEGLLDLDQPICEYVSDLPLGDSSTRNALTMRHLLTHQGGFEGDGFIENGTAEDALLEWVTGFEELDQVTPPGSAWSYSNTGFGLAGHVLARVSGTTYEDAMRKHVLIPLGLQRTGFGQPPAFENSATGYEFGDDGSREPRDITGCARSANPAGGLVSTVPDLLRLAAFQLGFIRDLNPPFLPDAIREEMQTPQVAVSQMEQWGIGWGLKREGIDTWTVEHGGWFNGFRAQLTILPDHQSALAILTTGPKGHEAIEHLQALLLAEEFGISPAPEEATYAGEVPHITGSFGQSHIDARFILDSESGDLEMHLKTKWHGASNDAAMVCPLTRLSESEYVVSDGEFVRSHITFFDRIPGTNTGGVRILNRVCLPI